MAQGQLKGRGKAKSVSLRKQAKAAQPKKHRAGVAKPKNQARLERFKQRQTVTRQINANIEQLTAAKVCQAGERLKTRDIAAKGKEMARDIKREALKRKKPRVEEKLEKLRAKLDHQDGKDAEFGRASKKQKGLLNDEVISRVSAS
uniref:Uncharacterized protein n=1 Tax=Rhizochromulina marina TaxID=1034831 RepID=A0A7S2WKX0_9STRA|mmetsp:Transcript_26658/g.77572  ORF Transcript_26658/g.77572 Transcript_26658/m.77572 type:complete len:146 (+) Transcript_26658:91-528(+)